MGQDISFTKVDSGNESTHIYSLNRSLTGMEIISYSDPDFNVDANSGADVLAKQPLDLGVDSISIYSNMVTINFEKEDFEKINSQVEELIVNVFRFYDEQAV